MLRPLALFTAALVATPALAQEGSFDLPNIQLTVPSGKLVPVARRNDNLCWQFDQVSFLVRNRDALIQRITVTYENGNTDEVRGLNRIFKNGPMTHGPFAIDKVEPTGKCVASFTIVGDDVDADGTPGKQDASFSTIDLKGIGRLWARPEREGSVPTRPAPAPTAPAPTPQRPAPPPPTTTPQRPTVVVQPIPQRPAPPPPVYQTQTRYVLDTARKDLIANPSFTSTTPQAVTVALGTPEKVGALQLVAHYDDAYIDEIVLTFADRTSQKIEFGAITANGWVVRDGVILLGKGQTSGMLDLTGYGNRWVTGLTIRGHEAPGGEANAAGVRPVIEVYAYGNRAETVQVCTANCP
jgi:hypothetical protein